VNICVTLNPCLDKSLVVPPWSPGEHQVRGTAFQQVVGGKGVNVARGLCRLGQPAQPALFLGGELGRLCARLLQQQDGFVPIISWTTDPTREILTVRTEGTAEQTAFFDPNPTILHTEKVRLQERLEEAFARDVVWCAMSGSSPCNVTDDFYAWAVQSARESGVRTLVDTYGTCFQDALQAGPDVVKMNRSECEQAIGQKLHSATAVEHALRWIRSFGVGCAAITFGQRGMAASWNDAVGAWQPPRIQYMNPIGAGDAMSAGLIDALTRFDDHEKALRWAMACAVCSVERWIACDFDRSNVESMDARLVECSLDALVA
jgi:1-phosphofructokinase family hexose kinase